MIKQYVRSSFFVFIFILLNAISSGAFASINDYVVKQWSTLDGLASQSLKSVVQDKQGYIWIGTQFGLSRFDGQQFTNFTTSNSKFLPSNSINKLMLDRDGLLWVGTKKGLVRLDPKSLSFTKYNVKGPVRDILEDNDNRIWIAANGLYLFSQDKFKSLNQIISGISSNRDWVDPQGRYRSDREKQNAISQLIGSVNKMALSPEGIWLINNRFLLRLTNLSDDPGAALRLEITAKVSLPERLGQAIVYDLSWIDGNLYLASELGAYFLDFLGANFLDVDEELRPFALPHSSNKAVYKFMSDADGALWVSSYGRLFYRDDSGEWQWIEPTQLGQNIWFSDIFQDREKNIWLTSLSEGLWKVHAGNIKRHKTTASLTEAIMAVTLSPDGHLWAATQSGVGYFDANNEYVNEIPLSELERSSINDMFFQGSRLYLGTDRGVVYYQDGKVETLPGRALRYNPVLALAPSSSGGIWIGTARGLFRQAYSGLKPFVYNAFLDSKFITYVMDKGTYGWLGTSKGAYYFTDKGIERTGSSTALENAYVTSILEVAEVGTFIGTLNDGLFYRDLKKQWRQFDISNGLPYGPIFSLHFDENLQQLWVSTLKGVYRLPVIQFPKALDSLKAEQVITSLDRQLDGKPSQCCAGYGHDAVADQKGSLWYPSLKGLVEVPKNIELFGSEALTPHIESIITDKRSIGFINDDKTVLDTDERNVTIKYTAIDYSAPKSIEFRYKLLGLDNDWRYAKMRREAIYTNLSPGTFVFELSVKRVSESWDDAIDTELVFVVPKTFDETVYFRLMIISIFFLVFYLLFWMYRAQERRKQIELEKQVETRTQELKSANDKLNNANSQLKEVSHNDELTGLRSRRFLFDQLPKDIEHFQRNRASIEEQGKAMALLIINLDDFSRVNDTYGPMAGDSCLQQVAALLNSKTQGSDYIVRWSGDEFLLLLRDMRRDAITRYVKRLGQTIALHNFKLPNGKAIHLTSSMGWAFYPLPLLGGQIIGWETSINIADLALHRVKDNGRNGYATFSFDEQLDAFEFENSENIEVQLNNLLETGLSELKIWKF